jgi:ABC-type uncharacterized transport system involved in gliding motility auxiliary subunit
MKKENMLKFTLISSIVLLVIAAGYALISGDFGLVPVIIASAGLAALVFYTVSDLARVKEVVSNRATRYGAAAVVYSVLVVSLIFLAQSIFMNHSVKWDLTKNQKYTLSDQSVKVLKNLKTPVDAYMFYSEKSIPPGVEDTLKLYEKVTPKFKYQAVDMDRNPALAARFKADRYGIIVLSRPDNNAQEKIDTLTEQGITNALIRITRESKRKIYFTKGHGEPSLDAPKNEKTGYSVLKEELQSYNYDVADIELFSQPQVPKDCNILVIAGPQSDLFDREAVVINTYLMQGGKLIVFEAPMFNLPKLDAFLKAKGIVPQNDIVVDKMGKMFGGDPLMPIIATYGQHEITNSLNIASFMPNSRTFSLKNGIPGITLTELARTSPGSWGETDLSSVRQGSVSQGPQDLAAPLAVAVVSSIDYNMFKESGSREASNAKTDVVVFGSSDFVNNTFLGTQANMNLVLNAFNYLGGQGDTIAISPKETSFEPLFLSNIQGRLLLIVPVIFLPLLCIAFGVMVYLRRRMS